MSTQSYDLVFGIAVNFLRADLVGEFNSRASSCPLPLMWDTVTLEAAASAGSFGFGIGVPTITVTGPGNNSVTVSIPILPTYTLPNNPQKQASFIQPSGASAPAYIPTAGWTLAWTSTVSSIVIPTSAISTAGSAILVYLLSPVASSSWALLDTATQTAVTVPSAMTLFQQIVKAANQVGLNNVANSAPGQSTPWSPTSCVLSTTPSPTAPTINLNMNVDPSNAASYSASWFPCVPNFTKGWFAVGMPLLLSAIGNATASKLDPMRYVMNRGSCPYEASVSAEDGSVIINVPSIADGEPAGFMGAKLQCGFKPTPGGTQIAMSVNQLSVFALGVSVQAETSITLSASMANAAEVSFVAASSYSAPTVQNSSNNAQLGTQVANDVESAMSLIATNPQTTILSAILPFNNILTFSQPTFGATNSPWAAYMTFWSSYNGIQEPAS
jgi:hypothetical protein